MTSDRKLVALGAALLLSGCNRTPSAPAGSGGPVAQPDPSSVPSAPPLTKLPALGAPSTPERTEDGIPILPVRLAPGERAGSVRFIRPLAKTLQWTSSEASDGARVWVGISRDGPDVIVRDGEVHEGVLRQLGVEQAGCAAARDGEILLSGLVKSDRQRPVEVSDGRTGKRTRRMERAEEQAVFRIVASGTIEKQVLPPTVATSSDCRLWMQGDGKYALATFGIVTWDGARFSEDRSFFAGRTTMGAMGGPKFCFRFCNAEEQAATHPATREILDAVGGGSNADFAAHGPWVAATAQGVAVRFKDGALERLTGIPESKMLNGHYDVAFTERGDLVIAFDYRFARYAVWPVGAKALSPVRTLPVGDVLAKTSPTVIVRGLGGSVPASTTYAVLLGKPIGYGTGGGTFGFSQIERSSDARRAQVDRAKAVLGKDRLLVAHEAVIEPECGAHVRSPVGWEGMKISDFSPPTLPKLSPRAVTKKPACLPIRRAAVLPGAPDLLLALSGSELFGAWLPPPLPLPRGSHFGRREDVGPVVQHPKPGSGWTRLGAVDAILGEDAVEAPGVEPRIEPGTWQAGGAAILRVAEGEVILTPRGAALLPKGARPMAVGTAQSFHVWGSLSNKLVDCAERCRLLDPGVAAEIVAVVPRTETTLLLGYADGRVGVYDVPSSGGEVLGTHPLVEALVKQLKARPTD